MTLLLKVIKALLVTVFVFTSVPLFAEGELPSPSELQAKLLEILEQKSKEQKVIKQLSSGNFKKKKPLEKKPLEKKEIYIAEGYVPAEVEDVSKTYAQTTVDSLFTQSIELRKTGRNDRSIELLYKVLSLDPSHHRARLILARELVVSEQYTQVESLLLPLLHKSNNDWRPWFLVGTAQLMSEELDLAAYSLDKALSEAGRYEAAVWVQRAVVEQQRNNPQNALQLLGVAADLDPDDPQIYINLAYAYEDSGDGESALAYYQRFLESPLGTEKNNALRKKVVQHLAQRRSHDSMNLQSNTSELVAESFLAN